MPILKEMITEMLKSGLPYLVIIAGFVIVMCILYLVLYADWR